LITRVAALNQNVVHDASEPRVTNQVQLKRCTLGIPVGIAYCDELMGPEGLHDRGDGVQRHSWACRRCLRAGTLRDYRDERGAQEEYEPHALLRAEP
jgi:hypothetical protein